MALRAIFHLIPPALWAIGGLDFACGTMQIIKKSNASMQCGNAKIPMQQFTKHNALQGRVYPPLIPSRGPGWEVWRKVGDF